MEFPLTPSSYSIEKYLLAIEKYTDALSLNPTNPSYLTNRSQAYINVKNYDRAIRDAQVAQKIDP